MTTAATQGSAFRSEFEALQKVRGRGEPAWVRRLREAGLARFEEMGFPTTRLEDWKYTSVAPIARTAFRRPPASSMMTRELPRFASDLVLDTNRIVFVGGRHAPQLSRVAPQAGVEVASLTSVLSREPAELEPFLGQGAGSEPGVFAHLNTAFLEDGAFVRVQPGTVLASPIQLLYLPAPDGVGPTVSHPRTLLLLGRASQATILETYVGPEEQAYFTNAVTEIVVEDGAVLDHYKLQREGRAAFHVGTMAVRQGRSSQLQTHSIALGGALTRNDVDQVFEGEGGDCVLSGLFVAGGTQHTDTHTRIDHARPHCVSRELYKGIVDGSARGVFVGRILVRKDAQKTDAQQTNKNLLLSRDALVQSVPQLEILADDVKCKHGSTTGQLDATALFYLRSRGIDEASARNLLTYAFASDLVGRIRVPSVRSAVASHLRGRLPGGLGAEGVES
jgi:Fe-S cluster assembly protein SufD